MAHICPRTALLLLALAAATPVAARRDEVRLAACAADTDCTLNGICNATSGSCTCFKPWTGATCAQLKFGAITAPVTGYGEWPLSTWGGNAIQLDGIYHLFVAEMVNNCTLTDWGKNSQCTHAVSASPEGPYVKHDTALGVWCHNPQVSYVKGGGAGGQDLWALWHIGGANGGNPAQCNTSAGQLAAAHSAGQRPATSAAAASSPLHLANSPNGPWAPFVDWKQPSCNNPTQVRHPNGTWFLNCDSTRLYRGPNVTGAEWRGSHGCCGGRSGNYNNGPFTFVTNIPTGPVHGTYEDGFLYIDNRGNWHNFFHVYTMTCDTPLCDPTAISGHSFSRDGVTWLRSPVQPYFNTANVTDGSVVQMSTRERPKLFFGEDGEPTHLANGVDVKPHCPPAAAIQCKVSGDHTQTLIVPLDYS